MNISNSTLSIQIKENSRSEFMTYYQPEEIHGYCSRCPNFKSYWTCPPHNFDIPNHFQRFNHIYLIGIKIALDKNSNKESALEHYHAQKLKFNERLLALENDFDGSEILIAGHCWHCKSCSRIKNKSCLFPNKMRHSLESLGIKISSILMQQFNDELQWQKDNVPSSLYIVQAILSPHILNCNEISSKLLQ